MCGCAGSRRDLAAAGFLEKGTQTQGNLRNPMCGSRALRCLCSCSGPGALCRQRSRTSRLLAAHLGSAGGWRGTLLLPTPFPSSKSKSLFLRSSGCRPAVRQPDGKGTGALLPSLLRCLQTPSPDLALSRSPGLRLELCQALGVDGARCCSCAAPRVAGGAPQVPPPNLQLRRARGRIAKSLQPAVPGWLCPAPL